MDLANSYLLFLARRDENHATLLKFSELIGRHTQLG
jgi:hypothetical protein